MSFQTLIKRTIFVAEHPQCDFRDVRTDNPPRSIQCPICKQWVEFKEESWTGPAKL